jgi:SAM-dependent methyltransferase
VTHSHDDLDVTTLHSAAFWDERYGSGDQIWSGRPNQRLVESVSGRAPGSALDIGCGEGADAIWLAGEGWTVTAVDVSAVALQRAARQAAAAGPDVAARIAWRREDLREWTPEPESYDLVSEQFLHLPSALRIRQHERFAAAVRPGGMLLVVGHHPGDNDTMQRPHPTDLFFTAEEEAGRLSPLEWDVSATTPTRSWRDPDGKPVTISDAVVRAVRRS